MENKKFINKNMYLRLREMIDHIGLPMLTSDDLEEFKIAQLKDNIYRISAKIRNKSVGIITDNVDAYTTEEYKEMLIKDYYNYFNGYR